MKYAFYSTQTIDGQLVGSNEPLGDLPLTFINGAGGGNIPTIFSKIESSETVVENVITGVDSIVSASSSVSVSLISGQSITIQLIRSAGNWGTVTYDPALQAFITEVSKVDDILTLQVNTATTGTAGDYLAVDYDADDYLTTGLNQFVGCYTFIVENDAAPAVTLSVCIYPSAQIRRVCADDVLNFAWFNSQGGFNSYALECKFIKGRNIGRQTTYLTADKILKKNQLDDVYDSYELASNSLTKIELDLLQALRSSVQAYLYNNVSLAWDIPIVVDGSSVQTYGNRFNQAETKIGFSFRVAKQVEIQTQ